jgi:hypothetical protein
MLQVGDKIPAFKLQTDAGTKVNIGGFYQQIEAATTERMNLTFIRFLFACGIIGHVGKAPLKHESDGGRTGLCKVRHHRNPLLTRG